MKTDEISQLLKGTKFSLRFSHAVEGTDTEDREVWQIWEDKMRWCATLILWKEKGAEIDTFGDNKLKKELHKYLAL